MENIEQLKTLCSRKIEISNFGIVTVKIFHRKFEVKTDELMI